MYCCEGHMTKVYNVILFSDFIFFAIWKYDFIGAKCTQECFYSSLDYSTQKQAYLLVQCHFKSLSQLYKHICTAHV